MFWMCNVKDWTGLVGFAGCAEGRAAEGATFRLILYVTSVASPPRAPTYHTYLLSFLQSMG